MHQGHPLLCLRTNWAARRPRRAVLVCVLVAWVLATLAPGLSRCLQHMARDAGPAAPHAVQAIWGEVCGPHGMHWVRLDTLEDPAPGQPSDPDESLNACAHCVLAVDRLAPLVPPGFLSLTLLATYSLPDWTHKPLERTAYAGTQARGPPGLF